MSVVPAGRLVTNGDRDSSLPAELREGRRHLDVLSFLQLLLAVHEVVDSVDDYLDQLHLGSERKRLA